MKVKRLHFVCRNNRNVIVEESGCFVSGIWKVSAKTANEAEFLALHESRDQLSYRQGRVLTVKPEKHEGRVRYVFTVQESDEPVAWEGNGAGEKGYGY